MRCEIGEGRPSSGRTPALSRTALLTDRSRLSGATEDPRRYGIVYRPSQTPHLPLSPERVTPRLGRALDTRSESPLGARLPASPAARRQPRRPARSPRERDPTGTVAGEIREKGPARVQSRRHRPPNPIPSTGPPSTRRQTPPPENLRNSDAVRHHRQRPREAGRAPRFQRRREAGDGMTAPPAAARAQPRFAPQPDRPSP
ncbi:hypothetical protein VZT92_015950 [Zoarces viviparus]|uniref:Uncharacterized protein n=1 Tax=Zoarces viviparus TaxID=48416 RepID=A0AAW1EU64_ZOAVI